MDFRPFNVSFRPFDLVYCPLTVSFRPFNLVYCPFNMDYRPFAWRRTPFLLRRTPVPMARVGMNISLYHELIWNPHYTYIIRREFQLDSVHYFLRDKAHYQPLHTCPAPELIEIACNELHQH